MKDEIIIDDHAHDTPPITPDNCDLVICYDFSTREIVPYLVNKTPQQVTNKAYHDGLLDIGNWIVKNAINAGVLKESSKRVRRDDE